MRIFGKFGRRARRDLDDLLRLLVGNGPERPGDFRHICSDFRTGHIRLDNMVYGILGMSGDEALAAMRGKKRQPSHQKHRAFY